MGHTAIEGRAKMNLNSLISTYLDSVYGTIKPITLEGYESVLSVVKNTLGGKQDCFLTQQQINDYVSTGRKQGAGRGIIKELVVLRNALHYMGEEVHWKIPRTLTRLPKRESYTPTPAEVRIILRTLEPRIALGASLALYAGLRDSECTRIPWSCYDATQGILSVPGAIRKTGTDNVLPVVKSLEWALTPIRDGRIVPVYKGQVESELKKVSRRMGIPLLRGYQPFRRVLCTLAEDAGWGQDSIALITGHSRTSMVSRYSPSSGRLELKRKILEDVERILNTA